MLEPRSITPWPRRRHESNAGCRLPLFLVACLVTLCGLRLAQGQPTAGPSPALPAAEAAPIEATASDIEAPVAAQPEAARTLTAPPDTPDVANLAPTQPDESENTEPPPSFGAALVALLVFAFAVWVAIRIAQASLRLGPQ